MTIWCFLKKRMKRFGNLTAFTEGKISYRQLIKLVECKQRSKKKQALIIDDRSRLNQAINILKVIAKGDVAVPVEKSYGEKREVDIRRIISKSNDNFKNTSVILFTSGTTGKPKGVKLSHKGIIKNIIAINKYFKVKKGNKILISRPLSHSAVLTGELLFGLYKGLEIDFYEEIFQPNRLAKYIDEKNVEIFCCTPTLIYHIFHYIKGSSLQNIVLSGERLSERVIKVLKDSNNKNIRFYNVYGLTENSPRVSALPYKKFFLKPGSIGKPLSHTKIKIENNELLLKSPSLMQGYIEDSLKTQEKYKKGYFCTGDLAMKDKEGYLYVLGRKDNMIIRSGMNIYPCEIEDAAMQIEGVRNCKVFGKDDVCYGQKICMKISCDISEALLRKMFVARLPPYLVPDEIILSNNFELTESGKVKIND